MLESVYACAYAEALVKGLATIVVKVVGVGASQSIREQQEMRMYWGFGTSGVCVCVDAGLECIQE